MRRMTVLACACALAVMAHAGAARADFPNPVIPDNFPDPSVIQVGGWYWASGTSGNWAPVFPLYRSQDLIHWKLAGAIFPKAPSWAHGNFWAPGLAYENGVWSVYYSASRADRQPPCVAVAQATSPTGPYVDKGFIACPPAG